MEPHASILHTSLSAKSKVVPTLGDHIFTQYNTVYFLISIYPTF